MKMSFRLGIENLSRRHREWLAGRRVGLISHRAAVDSKGRTSAERLWNDPGANLVALYAPEHGFFGNAGAGEICRTVRHPEWSIPIHSLYGKATKPTRRMLRGIDVLVFDLQNLATRCYTYVSTLKLALEAAAEAGIEVVIADRPVPLPSVVDGPILDETFSSFVGLVATPMVYGMTPGETALWLKARLNLDLDVKVAEMTGYGRQPHRGAGWPPWVPPSPAIRSWDCGMCYPATVCFEALPAVDYGRGTRRVFQLIGGAWIRAPEAAEFLSALDLPGIRFRVRRYRPRPAKGSPGFPAGVQLEVTDPVRFRPIFTAVSMIHALQTLYGKDRLWAAGSARPDFFDRLFGTDSVRKALLDGDDGKRIAARWTTALAVFDRARKRHLMYSGPAAPA